LAKPRKIKMVEEFYISTDNKTNKKLTLTRTTPFIDECKSLIAKMVKQTVKDYCNLYDSKRVLDFDIFLEAQAFLFDDDYQTNWGGKERNLRDFLDIIGVEIEWFRKKVEETRIGKKHRQKRNREEGYVEIILSDEDQDKEGS